MRAPRRSPSISRRPALRHPSLPHALLRANRPGETAQWTTLVRAFELRRPEAERIVTDEYAPAFLSAANRHLLRAIRVGSPIFSAAERVKAAAISTFVLCRHRFIDDRLRTALDDGVEQVLILGAGYDSRAYRFAEQLAGRPVHEVDLAPLSRRKAQIVDEHPELFGHTAIRRIEIDFLTQSLEARLLESGFAVGARTFVVLEGVSMYLTAPAVQATVGVLNEVCGTGSVLTMDLFGAIHGLGPLAQLQRVGLRTLGLLGEPIDFALAPTAAPGFLAEHGFAVVTLAEADDLGELYCTDHRASDPSVYVLAARR